MYTSGTVLSLEIRSEHSPQGTAQEQEASSCQHGALTNRLLSLPSVALTGVNDSLFLLPTLGFEA